MRIVFSKNRAAQLDLLLRSLAKNAWTEDTRIIWYASTEQHLRAYLLLERYLTDNADWRGQIGNITPPHLFDRDLRAALNSAGPVVTFFCDDDVVFRPVPYDPAALLRNEELLTFSWRLSQDAMPDQAAWRWPDLARTDHGYPGSIDGHVFRTAHVQDMIGQEISDPTALETVLAEGCELYAERRPVMAAFADQVLVGVPVNRVAERSGCPHGERHPQSAESLAEAFLAGGRISVDSLDWPRVSTCHHEVEFAWDPLPTAVSA